jgi:glycine cleavage system regulatory protein
MQKWQVTFVDDHGVQSVEEFECEQQPDMEHAAQLIRAKLLPVPATLDLNDLEGRTLEPTVKSLKDQNSIQILNITPI